MAGKRAGQPPGTHARRRRRLNKPAIEHYNVPDSDEEKDAPTTTQLVTNWEIRDSGISTSHTIINIASSPDHSPVAQHLALHEHDDPPPNTFDFFNEHGEFVAPECADFLEEPPMNKHRARRTKSVSSIDTFQVDLAYLGIIGSPLAGLARRHRQIPL